ncbi:MAG: SdrD B-like domain-containing protein, partial [Chloroflexota bacterium]|nr:SdrD B-like domain-containing protein [Chloroflexota bacterium]
MRRVNLSLLMLLVLTIAALFALIQTQTRLIAAQDDTMIIGFDAASDTVGATATASATWAGTSVLDAVSATDIFSAATPTRTPTPVNIGNFVWDDLDQDGRQDAGEPGLSGVTVQLWNDAKNSLLDSTVTNGSGVYSLQSSGPGSYRVREVLPSASDQFSPKNQAGGDDTLDSDINPSGADINFTDIVVIASNVISTTVIDAGIIKYRTPTPTRTPTPVNFGNFVWDDLDGDGRQDAGEPGLSGVSVQLWNDAKNSLLDSTVTNGSGVYSLQSSGPGSYRVRVVLPSASDQFSPKNQAGGDDLLDSDINVGGGGVSFTDIVVIASNVISTTSIDAGIIKFRTPTPTRTPTPINIGNFVWDDLDGDGSQDVGEPGIAGVTVQLWNEAKNSLLYEDITDSNGAYSVVAPVPGSYRVRVLKPSSADDFSPKNQASGDDTKDSDINPSGADSGFTDVFTLASNVISTTIVDAGIITADPVTIGNYVWWDTNESGIQGSPVLEPGLAGRRVNLRVDASIDYTVSSAITDAGGFFIVTAPEAGTYYLCVVVLASETITLKDATTDTNDSDINPIGARRGCTDNFVVSVNTTSIDAGFTEPGASIVGSVTLQGRGAAPNALWSLPHRLRVVNSGGVAVVDQTVTTNT